MTHRVLLVVSTLDGSGPGRVLTTLAQSLDDSWEPVLVSTHGVQSSRLIDEARASGISVEHLGMRAIWDVAGVARFASLVGRYQPAVIHTRTIRADLVGRAGRARGVPVINNLVNLYPDDSVTLHGRAAGTVLTRLVRVTRGAARLLVANAHAVAENARAVFAPPADRVRVVYDGLDLGRFAVAAPADLTTFGVPADAFVFLSVARLHPQKSIDDLIAAAALVRGAGAHVVVAGDGPSRGSLQTAIDRAGLNGHVHLLGDRADVPALLARGDAFVLPSRFEGLPSAIIEAMAAALPVIATDVGGVGELVVDGETGWLVPPAAPLALADAMRAALVADRSRLGGAGRSRAGTMFAASTMAREFTALYEEVAA